MALGSVIADIQSIVGGGLFTFRTVSGTEALIKGASGAIRIGASPNEAGDIELKLKKVGVGVIQIYHTDGMINQLIAWGVLLNNDFEIEIHNPNASTQYIGFWGMQTR